MGVRQGGASAFRVTSSGMNGAANEGQVGRSNAPVRLVTKFVGEPKVLPADSLCYFLFELQAQQRIPVQSYRSAL
jgi:hypothetical protein